jgi:phosphotransferase system enzyme I (PtsP)
MDLNVQGIGLYRTEFPFLVRSNLPSEEEQYLVYKRLCDEMGDLEVTIRTLDIGGEKLLPYLEGTKEANPELGLRSIRFSLHYREIFLQQLRAILRAGDGTGKLKIVFPMISAIDEFRQARHAVEEAMVDLARKKLPFHPSPALGAMIELPAVLDIIHELAKEADFFPSGPTTLFNTCWQWIEPMKRWPPIINPITLPFSDPCTASFRQPSRLK